MATDDAEVLDVDGREVRITSPGKVFFSARGESKLDLARYYLAVGPGALAGVKSRPTVLKRFPNGAEGDSFFQKRVPKSRPDWLRTVTVAFPSGPYERLDRMVFTRPVAASHWLQSSNPSERWKWDFMYQDLPPVKGHSVQTEGVTPQGTPYIPLKPV